MTINVCLSAYITLSKCNSIWPTNTISTYTSFLSTCNIAKPWNVTLPNQFYKTNDRYYPQGSSCPQVSSTTGNQLGMMTPERDSSETPTPQPHQVGNVQLHHSQSHLNKSLSFWLDKNLFKVNLKVNYASKCLINFSNMMEVQAFSWIATTMLFIAR